MIPNNKLVLFLVIALGTWGCARVAPASNSADSERIKILEARTRKLEEDFRTAAATRDRLREKLQTVENDRIELQKQIPSLVQERNELRLQITTRIAERDAVQVQYEQFRTNIRSLLGQAESAASQTVPTPVTSAAQAQTLTPGKS